VTFQESEGRIAGLTLAEPGSPELVLKRNPGHGIGLQ
jgi:hypothetical protein